MEYGIQSCPAIMREKAIAEKSAVRASTDPAPKTNYANSYMRAVNRETYCGASPAFQMRFPNEDKV